MHMGSRYTPLNICLGLAVAALLLGAPGALAQDVKFELGPGEEQSHTFDGVGSGKYHCHTHPGMGDGDIEVLESDGSEPETHEVRILDDDGGTFEPLDLTIRSGDTIRWVNDGDLSHEMMVWEPGSAGGHHEDGHGDHDHGHGDGHDAAQEAPALLSSILLLAVLGLVALARRR